VFLDRAIQPQDDIISSFSLFDGDGAEICGIDSGPDGPSISFPLFSLLLPFFLSLFLLP
jgi:hypothetical protein